MNDVLSPALVIAIDGPSGSGKSSTSRAVAKKLRCGYLDTGSMYRALTIWCADQGIAADDEAAVIQAADELDLEVAAEPEDFRVRLAGNDVTDRLHTPATSGMVSGYARIRAARDLLTERMRAIIAERGRIVVEGRDITTVVAPDAQVRVLLVADASKRIARRELQLAGAADHDTVSVQVVGRDAVDAQSSDFQTPAAGVTLIDSTELDLDEVVAKVIDLVPPQYRGVG